MNTYSNGYDVSKPSIIVKNNGGRYSVPTESEIISELAKLLKLEVDENRKLLEELRELKENTRSLSLKHNDACQEISMLKCMIPAYNVACELFY